MAHDKLYGICESKCKVEVPSLEQYNEDLSSLSESITESMVSLSKEDRDFLTKKMLINMGKEILYDCTSLYKDRTDITTIDYIETYFVDDMSDMFEGCTSLTTIPQLDVTNCYKFDYMFEGCTSLTTIPQLDFCDRAIKTTKMFADCTSLTTIPDFGGTSITGGMNMFEGCTSLTTFTDNPYAPEGSRWRFVSKQPVYLADCPLDRASILKVFNGLLQGSGNSVFISSTTNSYLSEEDKAIATNKGWNIKVE